MQGNPLEWRWVSEKGVHSAVDSRKLVDALLTGRMTPHVWVWRTGWTSWLRASQVAELSTAIPKGARLPAVSVGIDPEVVEPPPIPSHAFEGATYVRRLSTPVPKPLHGRPLVRRPAAPTLVEASEIQSSVSQTLRPPGAVPPPPRTFSGAFSLDVQRAIDQASYLADDPAPSLSTVSASPDLVMRSVLGGAETTPTEYTQARTPTVPPPAISSGGSPNSFKILEQTARRRRLLMLGGAVLLIAGVASISTIAKQFASTALSAAPTETTSAKPASVQPCQLMGSAERLAPGIALNVSPLVATAADGQSLAAGFADTANSAAGILVDPLTRSVKYAFREAGSARVASVLPRVQGSQLSFAVTRDNESLKEARVIPGSPDFKFGQTVEGFARQAGASNPETVWPTDIDTPCTSARIATIAGVGHAVTFRQGGQSGSIQVGWLTEDGHSRTAPIAVKADAKSLGQPNIAASGSRVLVTFAARNSDSEPWAVHTALVANDGTTAAAQRLAPIAGGPGGDAIAPVAIGLGDGRFILQWSEGNTGHRQVRVQTLDDQLQPWGPASNISPPEANAGQGALWVNGANAVSLFVVNVGRSAELWAASLRCGS